MPAVEVASRLFKNTHHAFLSAGEGTLWPVERYRSVRQPPLPLGEDRGEGIPAKRLLEMP